MSDAFWALGTIVQYGDGNNPEAFTAIAELKDIGGPRATRDTVDVTNHQSVDGYEEILPVLKRAPNLTLPCNWLPTDSSQDGSTGMASLFDSGRRANFEVLLPDEDTSEITFAGYVLGAGPTALPVNGAAMASFDVKPTGKITWP